MAPVDRLAIERSILRKDLFSPRVIRTIQAARRPSTERIYGSTWRAFDSWCNSRGFNPIQATVPQVLDFLQAGLDRGLAPNTIRRQVSAISSVLLCGRNQSLTHHPMVRQFLKGASNLRPPTVHRYPSWDLHRVLDALTGAPFEPLQTVSLKFLTLKVAFLVAITSARRISELQALSAREDLCVFHQDRVVLRLDPSFIPKVCSCFHRAQELILPNFCPDPSHPLERKWHTLDVRRALRIYLRRTRPNRKSEALFVSFQPGSLGNKVTSTTIGRWLRTCIATAYQSQGLQAPNHITAHSTRSAATSTAWATQASLAEICRAATWASPSPFVRNYKLDSFASAEASFGRRVLQAVHRAGPVPQQA